MIDDMERTVLSRWYDIARAEGVTDQDCDRISGAFAYPGLRLELGAQERQIHFSSKLSLCFFQNGQSGRRAQCAQSGTDYTRQGPVKQCLTGPCRTS